MNIHFDWATLGVLVAVVSHATFTIWYAATFKTSITVKLDSLVSALSKVDKELEKRDEMISALFRKIDDINKRLYKVEATTGE